MKSKVNKLTFQNFPDSFQIPSVIFLTREGCHFCQKLKPIYNKISIMKKYNGIYDFYTVDVDEETLLYEKFDSDGVPTIYVVYENDGVEIPYPKEPPESGYGENDITNFLDQLME